MPVTWMNLEDGMKSEQCQSQKDKHRMILVLWGIERSQVHKHQVDCSLPGAGGVEMGKEAVVFMYKFQSWHMKCSDTCFTTM